MKDPDDGGGGLEGKIKIDSPPHRHITIINYSKLLDWEISSVSPCLTVSHAVFVSIYNNDKL